MLINGTCCCCFYYSFYIITIKIRIKPGKKVTLCNYCLEKFWLEFHPWIPTCRRSTYGGPGQKGAYPRCFAHRLYLALETEWCEKIILSFTDNWVMTSEEESCAISWGQWSWQWHLHENGVKMEGDPFLHICHRLRKLLTVWPGS